MTARETVRGITVDSSQTRDIDDAIWLTETDYGVRVDVTIADASSVVEPGSEIDLRACESTATRYFASGNSPMLPRDLAEHQLSLLPKQERNTLTASMSLNRTFEVTGGTVFLSKLTSEGRVAFDEIPDILKDKEHAFHEQLHRASLLSMGLLTKRRNAGAFALYDLNTGWITTEEGYLRQLEKKEETIGYIIIQELMVLANAFVAEFAVKNDIPVPFRNHTARAAAPDRPELMQLIEGAFENPVANLDVVRHQTHMLLDKAVYGSRLLGHFGLNLPAYLHFTSPIRRYADLVTHRQIRAFLISAPYPHTQDHVEAIALHLNEVMREEKEAKSQAMKEKAETKAKATLDSRRIEGLNGKDFERVVKVWARSTNEVPGEIRQAYLVRIGDNRVPLVCFMTVLTEAKSELGWQEIKEASISRMVRKPDDAMSVFSMASITNQWPQPEYESQRSGPDHAPVFQVRARLQLGDKTHVSGLVEGQTQKEAKQRAVLNLLCSIAGLPPAQAEGTESMPPPSMGPEPKIDWSKDPISALQEFSQALGQPAPSYEFKMSGPSHMPTIECICSFRATIKTATAAKKQDAKRLAAQAVASALGKR